MSKSKTIIAGLGVVAALGVAALPLASYAAVTQQSVSGNVDLYVEVQPAIAMTIQGNNDSNGSYGTAGDNGSVDVFSPTNPDYSSDPSVKYVVEGHTENHTTLASSSYASLLPQSKLEGDDTNNFKSTIKVYTNSKSGYALTVKDSDNTTALTKITAGEDPAVNDSIPAGSTLTAGTAAWAFKVKRGETTGAWQAIQESQATTEIATTTAKTGTTGDETVVYYGVSTSGAQATGVYTDTIVYTATTH